MQKPWALREVERIWRPGDQPQLSPGFHPAVSLPKGTALWALEKLRNPQLFFFLNVPLKMSKVDEGVGCGVGGVLTFVAAGSALHKRHHFWTEKP